MNLVVIVGRMTKDPTIITTGEGRKIAKFTLANNRFIKNEERTDYIDVVVFGKNAEVVEKYCRKGKQLCVVGRLEARKIVTEDGSVRKYYNVVCRELELLGSPGKNGNGTKEESEKPDIDMANSEEDPFDFNFEDIEIPDDIPDDDSGEIEF